MVLYRLNKPGNKFFGLILLLFFTIALCGTYHVPQPEINSHPAYLLFYTTCGTVYVWVASFFITPTPSGEGGVQVGWWAAMPAVLRENRAQVEAPAHGMILIGPAQQRTTSSLTDTSPQSTQCPGLRARLALAASFRMVSKMLEDTLALTLGPLRSNGRLALAQGEGAEGGTLNIDAGLYPSVMALHQASYEAGLRITVSHGVGCKERGGCLYAIDWE